MVGRDPVFLFIICFLVSLATSVSRPQENQVDDPQDSRELELLKDILDESSSGGLIFDVHVEASSSRQLLLEASGHLRNGRVCGLLGPSGSGKTTLLSSLLLQVSSTGENSRRSSLNRTGQILLYQELGQSPDHERRVAVEALNPTHIAYLQQQDHFFELLTVTETLELAAFLELPHVPAVERNQLVRGLLDSLGLAHVAHQSIGNTYNPHKGKLSGGERRRLSVALELVTEKQFIVADEPTTGLDSALSLQVMKLIRTLAVRNDIPCVISLHQPRSSIFNELLDDCILLAAGGRVCYAGDTGGALRYFAQLGYPVPKATNPSEFLVDLVSVDTENVTQAALDHARIDKLVAAFKAHCKQDQMNRREQNTDIVVIRDHDDLDYRQTEVGPLDWIPRFFALLRRSWRQNIRNRTVNVFRAVASAGNAFLLAAIFPTVRGTLVRASSVADRVALLSFGAINQCMMAYVKTAELFSKEHPVVQREQMREQYSALSYLLAKVGGELLLDASFAALFATVLKACSGVRISWKKVTGAYSLLTVAGASLGFAVGSWAPSEQLANTGGIPLLVVLMVVGVINPSGVDPSKPKPAVVRFIKQFSPFAYCIEALCLGEYPGMKFAESGGWFRRVSNLPKLGGLALVRDGDQVIEALGLSGLTYAAVMKQLALLTAGNLVLSWLGLLFHQRSSPRKKKGGAAFKSAKSGTSRISRDSSGKPVTIVSKVRI